MDPVTFSVAAIAYVGAAVGRKVSEETAAKAWEQVKLGWTSVFGHTPRPEELSTDGAAQLATQFTGFADEVTRLVSNTSSFRRLQLTSQALVGARILWIDDRPENNAWEIAMFAALGVYIRTAETTRSAVALLGTDFFDLAISDIARSSAHEGLEALPEIRHSSAKPLAVVFYVTDLTAQGVPPGAFGITNDPNELLHLVLDIVERHKL